MSQRYCFDTSALIEAWNKYYSMELCPEYWSILDGMAQNGVVFFTEEVKREIDKIDDDLKAWIGGRGHFVQGITEHVQKHVRDILAEYPNLVDARKDRSMADPWVVAHALAASATLVTKEVAAPVGSQRIKIPDVCTKFSVRCISDFDFIREAGIRFTARRE